MHDCYQVAAAAKASGGFFSRAARIVIITNEGKPLRYLRGVVESGIVPDASMLYLDRSSAAYAAADAVGLANLRSAVIDAALGVGRWADKIRKTRGYHLAGTSRNGSALIALQARTRPEGDDRPSAGVQVAFYRQEFSFVRTPLGEVARALGAGEAEVAQIEEVVRQAREDMLGVEY